jgi:tripartite-type tricarboxylate transporter receptor subunit TctC
MQSTQPSTSRRLALLGAAALGISAFTAPAGWAQATWPTKPVTMVVGFPPGGQTDFAGRVLLAGLQGALGQAVIIDNKAGVNGNIAAVDVMKAPADGYKLLVGNGSMTIASHVYTTLGIIDPRQLTPIGVMLQSALVLAVPATSPVKTYADFRRAGQGERQIRQGHRLRHRRSRRASARDDGAAARAPRQSDHEPRALQGQQPGHDRSDRRRLDAMFDATSVVAPFIKSGQLRPLLVTTEKRVPAFPDVPTAAEAGLKDFNIISFIGLYGPPNLPADIVKKASTALNTALKDATVTKGIVDRGDEPGGGTAEQLGVLTRNQYKTWGDVVKANSIKAD